MSDLLTRARNMSAMLRMCKKISFGSDADVIDELVEEVERLCNMVDGYGKAEDKPAATEGQQPVAWMDATGTELHKIIQDYQKRDMIASGGRQAERAPNYSIALFTRPSKQAVTEAMVEAVRKLILDDVDVWLSDDTIRGALKAAMEAGR